MTIDGMQNNATHYIEEPSHSEFESLLNTRIESSRSNSSGGKYLNVRPITWFLASCVTTLSILQVPGLAKMSPSERDKGKSEIAAIIVVQTYTYQGCL
jgi:hypothetical protein